MPGFDNRPGGHPQSAVASEIATLVATNVGKVVFQRVLL